MPVKINPNKQQYIQCPDNYRLKYQVVHVLTLTAYLAVSLLNSEQQKIHMESVQEIHLWLHYQNGSRPGRM